jgi:hypothetical protein
VAAGEMQAKALQAAAHKRAWERDKRKREQKEEEERSAKDLAREVCDASQGTWLHAKWARERCEALTIYMRT